MTTTYQIIFVDNRGSRAVESIAATVEGSWRNSVERFDGTNDLAFVDVPERNAEYLEKLLDEDDNVISYQERG